MYITYYVTNIIRRLWKICKDETTIVYYPTNPSKFS